MSRKKQTIDYEEIKRLAAVHETDTALSRALGKNPTYVSMMKSRDDRFRAAVRQGRTGETVTEGKPEREPAVGTAAVEEVAEGEIETARELTPEEFYKFGQEKLSHQEIAAAIDFPNVIGISQLFHKFPELREAYNRGKNGSPLGDEPAPAAFDEKELEVVYDAVAAKKLFFLHDIAAHVGLYPERVYNLLGELVLRKRIVRDMSGSKPMYRAASLRVEEPASVAANGDGASFDKLSREDIEDRIFNAIDAGYCGINQIKRYNGWALSSDVGAHLERLCFDEKLIRLENEAGTVTGFFRSDRQPVRTASGRGKFYTNGTHLEIEYESDDAAAKAPARKAVAAAANGGFIAKKRVITDEEMSAAVDKSSSQDGVAAALGFSAARLQQIFKERPELRAVYDREVAAKREAGTWAKGKSKAVAPADPRFTVEAFENFAFEGFKLTEIADKLNISYHELSVRMEAAPECRRAYLRGAEKRFEQHGFSESIETIAEAHDEYEQQKRDIDEDCAAAEAESEIRQVALENPRIAAVAENHVSVAFDVASPDEEAAAPEQFSENPYAGADYGECEQCGETMTLEPVGGSDGKKFCNMVCWGYNITQKGTAIVAGVDFGNPGGDFAVFGSCSGCGTEMTSTPLANRFGEFCAAECYHKFADRRFVELERDLIEARAASNAVGGFGDEKNVEAETIVESEERAVPAKLVRACDECGEPLPEFRTSTIAGTFCGHDCADVATERFLEPHSANPFVQIARVGETSLAIDQRPADVAPLVDLMPKDSPPAEELAQLPEPNLKSIAFDGGGSVDIALNFDPFAAGEDEFKFVYDLTRFVRNYEKTAGGAR